MNKRALMWAAVPALALTFGGLALAQYPIMHMVANKVIAKYQNASCEQLWQQRSEPKSAEEQRVVQFLREDPAMRTAFIDKVAAPIVNRMFECGMIP